MKLTNIRFRLRNCLLSDRFAFVHNYIQIITMFSWLVLLTYTKAYYVIYLIIGLLGFYCRNCDNRDKKAIFNNARRQDLTISAVFSLVIIAANYDIGSIMLQSVMNSISQRVVSFSNISPSSFWVISVIMFLSFFPFMLLGGTYIFFFILQFINRKIIPFTWSFKTDKLEARKVFLYAFAGLSVLYTSVMLLGFYPGVISTDSLNQLTQITENSYSNHHPFYHTMIIRQCILIGMRCFGDINIGIALYSIFSILFLSLSFAYSVVTVYQLQINQRITVAVFLFYLLFPNHILYSFTMWKDVPFSACCLMLTVALFRYFNKIGKRRNNNAAVILLSGLGVCLFRSNGLFAFVIVFLLTVLFFGKTNRKLCISIACVILIAFVMKHPILNALDVSQPDSVELLSVPLQQVARTVTENDNLTEKQKNLISKVVDIETIPDHYSSFISDPIKNHIRNNGNQEALREHKLDYAVLYLELGFSHPMSYTAAWIDQTKGYWNAGYDYWKFAFSCWENDIGIERKTLSNPLQKAFCGYCELFEYVDILKPLVSIGLYTWLLLLVAYIGWKKKNKLTVLLTSPCIAIILSLLISTPVSSEFRYAYASFCCLPFLAIAAFWTEVKKKENNHNGASKNRRFDTML